MDNHLQKLASILVRYSAEVKPGHTVLIRSESLEAQPLVQAIFQEVYRAGALPVPFLTVDEKEVLAMEATDDLHLLEVPDPMYKMMAEQANVMISIKASVNPRNLSQYHAEKQAAIAKAAAVPSHIIMQRGSDGLARWCVTQYPTKAFAQAAAMSQPQYEEFVLNACKVHLDDPVAEWQAVDRFQQRLVDHLVGKKHVHVRGANIDLKMSIEGRKFINANGKNNMPDGEIFTGPVENSVSGWVKFTYPAYYRGNEVDGIELNFEDGRVVKASAETNEPFLFSVLDFDAGSRYLGEFAIGTNRHIQRFTGSILFDEKIGGTVHMAVGRGYSETGSKNDSQVHWDMICDMRDGGEILVDGELFYKNGEFLA